MFGKTAAGYHGLVSGLLLCDKEFRIQFLRVYTETYRVSPFVLISMCTTMWGEGEGSLALNLVEKFVP